MPSQTFISGLMHARIHDGQTILDSCFCDSLELLKHCLVYKQCTSNARGGEVTKVWLSKKEFAFPKRMPIVLVGY